MIWAPGLMRLRLTNHFDTPGMNQVSYFQHQQIFIKFTIYLFSFTSSFSSSLINFTLKGFDYFAGFKLKFDFFFVISSSLLKIEIPLHCFWNALEDGTK